MVQNTNKLVITGFKELPAGSQVVIKTRIDVKQELGIGHVTTYADNDLFNIHINGSIIDHVKTDFGLNPVGYNAANIN